MDCRLFTAVIEGVNVVFGLKSRLYPEKRRRRQILLVLRTLHVIIEWREQPAGGGEFGVWAQVGIAMESETSLTKQAKDG